MQFLINDDAMLSTIAITCYWILVFTLRTKIYVFMTTNQ